MMKSAFEIGDKVVCKDATGSLNELQFGRAHVVAGVRRNASGKVSHLFLTDTDNNGTIGWFARRFVRVPDRTKTTAPAHQGVTATKPTRYDQVLHHLLAGHSLTQGEAIMLGFGTRLAATVHTLKKRGHNIVTRMKTDANGYDYAEYSLVTRNSRNGNIKRV